MMKSIVLKHYLLSVSLFLLSLSVVWAGTLEQGIDLFEKQDYAQAKKLWIPLAKQGDVRAQYNLALVLRRQNTDVEEKEKKSNFYLLMSRNEGLVDSYFMAIVQKNKLKTVEVVNDKNNSSLSEGLPVNSLVWLNKQKEKNYTLQLSTGKSKKHLVKKQKKLIASHLLKEPDTLHILTVKANEKTSTRYLLTYGVFTGFQQAKEHVSELPKSLQKSSPWIRQFGVLQSIVNSKER
jgi:TPR repeat protein